MTPPENTTSTASSRSALVSIGLQLVTQRLESVGCTIEAPPRRGAAFAVRTPSARKLGFYISTQHVGGYAFWPKRRFTPASDLLAAIVLISADPEPDLYVIPSTEWLTARSPFTDRDNVGKRSEPEYGVSLSRSSLPHLERFRWSDAIVKGALL